MDNRIRVVIADDEAISREGMYRILSMQDDINVVGVGKTVYETLDLVKKLNPDILLLDLNWFDNERAGVDIIEKLGSYGVNTKIVAITMYAQLMEPARRAGAIDAMTKAVPHQQLLGAIRNAYIEPKESSPEQPEKLNRETIIEQLTPREFDVLELLIEGKTDKQIAQALTISLATAKHHVSSILGKLAAPNRVVAVITAHRLNLIDIE